MTSDHRDTHDRTADVSRPCESVAQCLESMSSVTYGYDNSQKLRLLCRM